MPATLKTKTLVIGSGPAGCTATIYAARAGLAPIMVEGLEAGGQLTITSEVENWPGDESVLGPELMLRMRQHAAKLADAVLSDVVARIDLSARPFRAETDGGTVVEADTVIVATGATARWLGLPGETRLRGHGVSACATCDGFFFRGKPVVVIGGGNSAVEEALFLANFASKVTLVHRRDTLRADKANQNRLFAHEKIDVIWNHVVADVKGGESVEAVVLRHVETGAETVLPVDGFFVAIGHDPATALFRGQLAMDKDGYIRTDPDSTATSVAGVFAAGDVRDKIFRQAVTSAGAGCMAALEAERFVQQEEAAAASRREHA